MNIMLSQIFTSMRSFQDSDLKWKKKKKDKYFGLDKAQAKYDINYNLHYFFSLFCWRRPNGVFQRWYGATAGVEVPFNGI